MKSVLTEDKAMDPWNEALMKASPNSYHETFDDMVHGFMSSRYVFLPQTSEKLSIAVTSPFFEYRLTTRQS